MPKRRKPNQRTRMRPDAIAALVTEIENALGSARAFGRRWSLWVSACTHWKTITAAR